MLKTCTTTKKILYCLFPVFFLLSSLNPQNITKFLTIPLRVVGLIPIKPATLSALVIVLCKMMANSNWTVNKYALITGGTRGVGYGIAQKLAETGHHLILGYNSNTERADKAKQELMSNYGVRVFTVGGDVANGETIDALFDAVRSHFNNNLNVFVHNAGLYVGLTTQSSSEKAKVAEENPGFKSVAEDENASKRLNFNLYDYYQSVYPKCFIRCVEKALPLMKDGNGYIVAISSPGCNSIHRPLPMYNPGYGKAVLEHLVRNYAMKLARRRITCNCVIPGFVLTENTIPHISQGDPNKLEEYAEAYLPMKKFQLPENIGDAVAFLCSPKAAFITGIALDVDGAARWSD